MKFLTSKVIGAALQTAHTNTLLAAKCLRRSSLLQIIELCKEYLDSGDVSEATKCLSELDVPHFHHELVYQVTQSASCCKR